MKLTSEEFNAIFTFYDKVRGRTVWDGKVGGPRQQGSSLPKGSVLSFRIRRCSVLLPGCQVIIVHWSQLFRWVVGSERASGPPTSNSSAAPTPVTPVVFLITEGWGVNFK